MAPPVEQSVASDPIMTRLEDQISWYDRKSMASQKVYKRIKLTEIFAAATIPLISGTALKQLGPVVGVLGVLITVFEGVLHLGQYQQNWINYRSTCEALKHEKYTYLGEASPYSGLQNPRALLAERIESLVSQEHAKWASAQQESKQHPQDGK